MNFKRTVYILGAMHYGLDTPQQIADHSGLELVAIDRSIRDHSKKFGITFEKDAGTKLRATYRYRVTDWGALNPDWVRENMDRIAVELNLPKMGDRKWMFN